MTSAKSSVKSAARVEQGKASMAKLERDPTTGRIKSKSKPPAETPPAPAPAPTTGGAAPAAALPTHGFLVRHRRRSAS